MAASIEYLQDIIFRKWVENLWLLNNKAQEGVLQHRDPLLDLHVKMKSAVLDSEPKGAKAVSEQSFTLFCVGLSYGAAVAPKAVDKVSESKLVDAWRMSVLRNRAQDRYNVFEDVLKETVDRFGVQAAIAQYPADLHVAPADVADALDRLGCVSRHFAKGDVANMIRQAGNAPAAPAPKKGGPKA